MVGLVTCSPNLKVLWEMVEGSILFSMPGKVFSIGEFGGAFTGFACSLHWILFESTSSFAIFGLKAGVKIGTVSRCDIVSFYHRTLCSADSTTTDVGGVEKGSRGSRGIHGQGPELIINICRMMSGVRLLGRSFGVSGVFFNW